MPVEGTTGGQSGSSQTLIAPGTGAPTGRALTSSAPIPTARPKIAASDISRAKPDRCRIVVSHEAVHAMTTDHLQPGARAGGCAAAAAAHNGCAAMRLSDEEAAAVAAFYPD